METPQYIKSLLIPTAKQPNARKVWSIDLRMVWLPFFTATNTMGDTAIPAEALGCPLRLGYDKAGQVKFTASGRPVVRVAKELGDNVRLIRDNFTANLLNYAGSVIRERGEDYKAQVALADKAGEPLYQYDKEALDNALKAKAKAEAEAIVKAEAGKTSEAVTQAEAVVKEAEAEAGKSSKRSKRDLVPA
jgi:hypothetical protein